MERVRYEDSAVPPAARGRGRAARLRALFVAFLALVAFAGLARPAAAADAVRDRVLLLSADPHTSPGLLDVELTLRRVLADEVPQNVDIDVEHLDLVFGASPEYRQTLVTFIGAKYANRRPDIV